MTYDRSFWMLVAFILLALLTDPGGVGCDWDLRN